MLDQNLIDQLRTVFLDLTSQIGLVYRPTSHTDQNTLLELLNGLTQASGRIKISADETSTAKNGDLAPQFFLTRNGQKTGITFTGIPTGHEFTSLVLAILNADGKGRMPDQNLSRRIKNLKGPVRIRTFISLSCENCPDVVQALNQMSLIHEDFHHEMVDGAYHQDEVAKIGIQGVPSLVVDSKLIHSGKISLLDLVAKLEGVFGTKENTQSGEIQDLGQFDVTVVGGGPAGVAAAIYAVRKGFKTALIADRMGGQVQDTKGIENLISVPYTEGPELGAQLYKHVSSYPVQILEHRRVKQVEAGALKKVALESNEVLTTKSLIVATGAKWRELNIPGEKEYIGRGVAFCPHCDGPYYKGKKVAVVGGGNSGVEAAIDLAGIVGEVVLIEYNDQLKADQILVKKLQSLPNVSIITSAKTLEIKGDGGKVTSLLYLDRKSDKAVDLKLDGVFVQIGLIPNSQFMKGVVETTSFGEIVVDGKGRTSSPGIYAAGDVTTTPFKQIIIAMGEGAKAALTVFEDMMLK